MIIRYALPVIFAVLLGGGVLFRQLSLEPNLIRFSITCSAEGRVKVDEGFTREVFLTLTKSSDSEIIINDVQKSCGCFDVQNLDGTTIDFPVTISSRTAVKYLVSVFGTPPFGASSVNVSFQCSDPHGKPYTVAHEIPIQVLQGPRFFPSQAELESLPRTEENVACLYLVARTGLEFKVSKVSVVGCDAIAKLSKLNAAEVAAIKREYAEIGERVPYYKITLSFDEKGPQSGDFFVEADIDGSRLPVPRAKVRTLSSAQLVECRPSKLVIDYTTLGSSEKSIHKQIEVIAASGETYIVPERQRC